MNIPVLFPKIFDYPFTYKSKGTVSLNSGDFVKVPFGNAEITGVVWPHEQKTKKNFSRSKRPVQQRTGFGGSSFSHEKTGDMFKIYCKNQYETHASRSRELNNNIY